MPKGQVPEPGPLARLTQAHFSLSLLSHSTLSRDVPDAGTRPTSWAGLTLGSGATLSPPSQRVRPVWAFCVTGSAATCSGPGEVEASLKVPGPHCVFRRRHPVPWGSSGRRLASPRGPLACSHGQACGLGVCLREAGQGGQPGTCVCFRVCVCAQRSHTFSADLSTSAEAPM